MKKYDIAASLPLVAAILTATLTFGPGTKCLARGSGDPSTGVLGEFPVTPHREPRTGFHVGGVNPTLFLRRLTEINGIPLEELERIMKPEREMTAEDRGVVAKYQLQEGTSRSGFLMPGESLRERLVEENTFVVDECGTTHQEIARHLVALAQGEPKGHAFVYHDTRFAIVRKDFYYGYQFSPFGDGTGANADVVVTNLDKGVSIRYGLLLPVLMDRYGFYEGNVPYRLSPGRALAVLSFVPVKDEGHCRDATRPQE